MEKENHCGLHCTKINNISVTIGKQHILENINIHIHCGELTVIIGKNGAGKSTLLKAILGEVKHTGDITFLDMKENKKKKIRHFTFLTHTFSLIMCLLYKALVRLILIRGNRDKTILFNDLLK